MRARNRLSFFILTAAVAVSLFALPSNAQAEQANIEALLILASNNPAPLDARLDKVEYRLRRIFGFETYRYYGDGSTILSLPGQSILALGNGNNLTINARSKKGRIEAQIVWEKEGERVLNTTVAMSKNTPVILGGSTQPDGTLIIVLTAN